MRPLVSTNPKALLDFTERLAESPEKATSALPCLKAAAAIAHEEKCCQLEAELQSKHEKRQAEHLQQIERCNNKLGELDARLCDKLPEASAKASVVGICLRPEEPRFGFADGEPLDDEAIAGLLRIPLPKPQGKVNGALTKLVAVLGGGTLFGVSLGLLVSGVTLSDLSVDYPQLILFATLGMSLIYLIGSALTPLAEYVGYRVELQAIGSARASIVALIFSSLLLVGMSIAFLLIEAKVEQLGLLRTLTEESSLRSFSLSKPDIFIVSFVLSLPVIASYLATGYFSGVLSARWVAVLRAKTEQRQALLQSEQFAEATARHKQVHLLFVRRSELAYKIANLEADICDDLPLSDKQRLEDCQSDAVAAAYAAEDAIIASIQRLSSTGQRIRNSLLPGLWRAR